VHSEPAIEITAPSSPELHHSFTEHNDQKKTIQFHQNQNVTQPRYEYKPNSNLGTTTTKDDGLRVSPGNKPSGSPSFNPSNLTSNQPLTFASIDISRQNNKNEGLRISPGVKTGGHVVSSSPASNQPLTFLNADGNRPSNNNRFKKKLMFTKDTTNP
jgi:hypothetical protein